MALSMIDSYSIKHAHELQTPAGKPSFVFSESSLVQELLSQLDWPCCLSK